MPTYLKRKNIFTIVYTDKSGRRRWESTGVGELPQAEAYYRDHVRSKDSRFVMKISDLSLELQKRLAHRVAVKTVELYKTKLSIFVAIVGDKRIDQVCSNDIEHFMSERLKAGISVTTISIDFRTIRSAFNRAIKMGYLISNPFTQVEQYRNPHQDPAVFSEEEVVSIINAEENPLFKVYWTMLYLTAARRGEILYLEWDDIDFQRRTIRLRNKKDHTLKTKKPRTIPLSSVLFDVLVNLPRKGSFIFCKENGEVYSGGYVSKRFKDIVKTLKLSDEYHTHSLRHSAATRLNEMGESSFNIQASLGHSSVATTQLYIQTTPETLRAGYEKIAQCFKANKESLNNSDQSTERHDAASAEADGYKSLSLVG